MFNVIILVIGFNNHVKSVSCSSPDAFAPACFALALLPASIWKFLAWKLSGCLLVAIGGMESALIFSDSVDHFLVSDHLLNFLSCSLNPLSVLYHPNVSISVSIFPSSAIFKVVSKLFMNLSSLSFSQSELLTGSDQFSTRQ